MTNIDTSLDPADLLAEATARAGGLTDLGEGPFVDPLQRFSESLESEARLNPLGRVIASERIIGHTFNRLNYVNDRKRFAEIEAQEITRPVFIVGPPRTGTTILHDILAQDPASRAPMTWEVMFPSPPPQTDGSGVHRDDGRGHVHAAVPQPVPRAELSGLGRRRG